MKTKKRPKNAERLVNGSNGKPAYEEVALFAYYVWEQQERTDGHDVEDWQQAEMQLEATRAQE
jgi:hypothetical protein